MPRFRPLLRAASLALALALPHAATAQETSEPPTAGFAGMTEEARAAFRAEVRAYLLENPEVILEAIQVLEQRREQQTAAADSDLIAAHSEALFESPHSYVGGNPEGELTLVEFSDYRCGFCKRAHPIVAELLERRPDLRLVIKEFPILGPDSETASRMAQAALDLDPEKYEALNDALMAHKGNLTEAAAYRIANEVGYDIAELKARAAEPEIAERIQETYELAQALGLQGTPSFVVGRRILRGFLPLEEMLAVVDEEARAAAN